MAKQTHVESPSAPLILLLIMAICMVAWSFWVGTVFVRLWFYKGALGPEPEKFIIIPQHRKERMKAQQAQEIEAAKSKRMTVFRIVEPDSAANPFGDNAYSLRSPFEDDAYPVPEQGLMPTINVEQADHHSYDDGLGDLTSPDEIKKYLAEEHRISRLPTFEQDDCGDGSNFPDIPYSVKHTAFRKTRTSSTSSYHRTRELLTFKLKEIDGKSWLKVDNTYIEQWEARREILAKNRTQCIQATLDGEYACEELMRVVTSSLAEGYPHYFKIVDKGRTKHIKSDVAGIEYSLKRPFTFVPLEVCARVAVEDFNIFMRDDFTQQWYLQASATLFPVGYRIARYIGKSLPAIIHDKVEGIDMWQDLPDILNLISTTPTSVLTRKTTYIQTSPPSFPPSLSTTLHILRPEDLFAGTINALDPRLLLVRTDTHTFRLLPDSGAVVMAVKTGVRKLRDLYEQEREELMVEIRSWDEDEARFKGRDLWITSVEGFCGGRSWRRDDRTVGGRE